MQPTLRAGETVSDLADLAADVAKDLPAAVRKVIDTAIANGWELHKPGMSMVLRLNHPTDDLADPVYVSWVVGRTPTGRLSFRFDGCSTRGLVPLSGPDLLEYLADPTVVYPVTEELEAEAAAKEKPPKWDSFAPPEVNLMAQLGGSVISIQDDKHPRPRQEVKASPVSAAPLRVMIPGG